MEGFVNDFAKLIWYNIKFASKEDKLSLLMLYGAVQHPEVMSNMLPYYTSEEELEKEL